jgi:(2Fe-2S) ferredoxin
MVYDYHIFICTNDREGSEKPSCGTAHGEALIQKFKLLSKSALPESKIRINRSGCLGLCAQGPVVMIYPMGWCMVNVQIADVTDILNALQQNRPLLRLLWSKPEPK